MRTYWAVFSARLRLMLQYRAAAMAGCVTQLFWGLIRMMIFYAFYNSTTVPQPMTYEQVVTYIWLGQATILLVFTRVDGDIAGMIRSGNVAYEFLRPVNLFTFWFSRVLAERFGPLMIRMLPIMLISALFFGLSLPVSSIAGILWVVSTFSAILLSAAFSILLTICLLWTISGDGLNRLLPAAIYFLSGSMVPLPLFPNWLQPVLNILPFRGLMDTPFRIYLGHMPPSEAAGAILHQLCWTATLLVTSQFLLRRGARRLVIQGG